MFAVSFPEELIDAYDPPEYIDHVGVTVFVVPPLIFAVQVYVALPLELTLELPDIKMDESESCVAVGTVTSNSNFWDCLSTTLIRYSDPLETYFDSFCVLSLSLFSLMKNLVLLLGFFDLNIAVPLATALNT